MRNLFKRLQEQKGASLVEYALVVSLLALPSVSVMQLMSEQITVHFTALEANVSSSGYHSTAAEAPGPTPTTTTPPPTTTTTTTTTTTPPPTTTTTTTTPPPATTTTTTTTAAPVTTTTAAPGAPAHQSQEIETSAGTFTFVVVDGVISLDKYELKNRWKGEIHTESDGLVTIELERTRGNGSELITARLDANGFLYIAVS
jgi:Flp pilus assembly pilin Flp